MKPVVLSAAAKLTLSLRVEGVRVDGMHLIDAEMVSLDLVDTIELWPSDGASSLSIVDAVGLTDSKTETSAAVSTKTLVSADADNLVLRALDLVGKSAVVRLTKRIPAQAGLGGGSSDAGAILRWAGFSDLSAAAGLGADVAFCMLGGRARVSGIGEIVEQLPYRRQTFTLLTPPVGCPTAAVYRRWDELGGPLGDNGNDLEPAALSLVPELARWRDELAESTGCRPRLAGSGSSWFLEGHFPAPGRVVCHTVPADSDLNDRTAARSPD